MLGSSQCRTGMPSMKGRGSEGGGGGGGKDYDHIVVNKLVVIVD